MNIFLRDQARNFDSLLIQLMSRSVMPYDRFALRDKITTIDVVLSRDLEEVNLDFLFDYKIFPSYIMTYRTQWAAEQRKMKIGDTILQQVFLPPLKSFSQKIIFGVRINSIINEPARRGFSYETLDGHVEKGESIFTLEKRDGKFFFQIQSFSEPGNWLSKLAGPFFSLPYQAFCTRRALLNVKRQVT